MRASLATVLMANLLTNLARARLSEAQMHRFKARY